MSNITTEHLQRMAQRHHAVMQEVLKVQGKVAKFTERLTRTIEVGGNAWFGGMLEGKTDGASLGPIPLNLGLGALMIGASHINAVPAELTDHLNNLGTGFVVSYLAATGYAFGKRWRETGKLLGGGAGSPWTQPYENGWPKPASTAEAAP